MKIEKTTVEHVSKLARIKISEEEIEKFANQFESILKFFSMIDEIKETDVEPAFQPIEIKNSYREDEAKKFEWDPLSNTRHKEGEYFKGPRVV